MFSKPNTFTKSTGSSALAALKRLDVYQLYLLSKFSNDKQILIPM